MKYVLHKLLILEHDQVNLLFSEHTFTRFQFYDKRVINVERTEKSSFITRVETLLRLLISSFPLETVVLR